MRSSPAAGDEKVIFPTPFIEKNNDFMLFSRRIVFPLVFKGVTGRLLGVATIAFIWAGVGSARRFFMTAALSFL
jgi:hypothetical protein